MALSDRTKKINVVIGLKHLEGDLMGQFDFRNEVRDMLIRWECPQFALILHDSDTKEDDDGNIVPKFPHIHIYAELPKIKRLSTIINEISKWLKVDPFAVQIEKAVSMEGSVQYLIHKNDKDKYQYPIKEIVTNIDDEELALILARPAQTFNVDFILYAYENSRNLSEFIKTIGIEKYRLYRNVIRDLCGLK